MPSSRLLVCLVLVASLLATNTSAAAQHSPANGHVGQAPDPIQALEARNAWLSGQALVRTAMRVWVSPRNPAAASGALPSVAAPSAEFLMFIERTPHGRARVVIKDSISGPARLTYLVQDKISLAMSGEDVTQPAAPWMMGHYIFEQMLDPLMLLSWTMGLPGKDYAVGAPVAQLDVRDGALAGVAQAGWQVAYADWASTSGRPALPRQVRLVGDRVEVVLQVADFEAFATPPSQYKEFEIR